MTKTKLIDHLRKTFPNMPLVEDGHEMGWGKNTILIGAEENPHANYWDKNNNDTVFGIDQKLYDDCSSNGWYPEWNDAGTLLLFN